MKAEDLRTGEPVEVGQAQTKVDRQMSPWELELRQKLQLRATWHQNEINEIAEALRQLENPVVQAVMNVGSVANKWFPGMPNNQAANKG